MNIRALVIAGAMLAGGSLTAHAQFTLVKSVIGSGGTAASNGTYTLNGTIGQAVIGPAVGSVYSDYQGFWYGINQGPTGAVHTQTDGPAAGFALDQNYPNPFNPSTAIRFSIPERTKVTIRVMNLLGEEVKRVIDQETFESGQHTVDFYADDLPSGTYVYRMEAGNFTASKKMVLMK